MNQTDMMFLVAILILGSTLVVFVTQFIRSRRKRGDDGSEQKDPGAWWEGPWDGDKRPD